MRFFFFLEHRITKETFRCLTDSFASACRLAGLGEDEVSLISMVNIPEAKYLRGQGSRILPCCYLSEQGRTPKGSEKRRLSARVGLPLSRSRA